MNLLKLLAPKKPKGDALTPRGIAASEIPEAYLKAFPHNDLHKIKINKK